jgi:hypothetical protein
MMARKPVYGPRPLGNVWPDSLTKSDVLAIKSLGAGVATEEQQIRALQIIVEKFCGYYELTFDTESDRLTAFGEGRRFVAAVIQEVLKSKTEEKPSE